MLGLGTAVFFAVESSNDHSKAVQLRSGVASSTCSTSPSSPTCVTLANTVNSMGTDHTLSEAFYIGGGVLAAGAIAAWLLVPKEHTVIDRTGFVPILTPQLVGAAVTEAF